MNPVSFTNMLEMVLPGLNQTYEAATARGLAEFKNGVLKFAGLELEKGMIIRVSGTKRNDGYYEITGTKNGGHALDKPFNNGVEAAAVSVLAVPSGLMDIICRMCESSTELGDGASSKSVDGVSVSYKDSDLFKLYSNALAAYRRLKTL